MVTALVFGVGEHFLGRFFAADSGGLCARRRAHPPATLFADITLFSQSPNPSPHPLDTTNTGHKHPDTTPGGPPDCATRQPASPSYDRRSVMARRVPDSP